MTGIWYMVDNQLIPFLKPIESSLIPRKKLFLLRHLLCPEDLLVLFHTRKKDSSHLFQPRAIDMLHLSDSPQTMRLNKKKQEYSSYAAIIVGAKAKVTEWA